MKKSMMFISLFLLNACHLNDVQKIDNVNDNSSNIEIISEKLDSDQYMHVLPTMEDNILTIYPQFDYKWFIEQRDLALMVVNVDEPDTNNDIIAYEYINNIDPNELDDERIKELIENHQSQNSTNNSILILINYHDAKLFDNVIIS